MDPRLIVITFCYILVIQANEYIPNDYQWLMQQPAWNLNVTFQFNHEISDNVDQYQFVDGTSLPQLVVYPHWTGVYNVTNTNKQANFSAFVAQINNNSALSFEIPDNQCSKRQITSITSKEKECEYATNGGFFSFSSPYCLPQLISNGIPIAIDYNDPKPKVSLGIDVNNKLIDIGYINIVNKSTVDNYYNLLTGTGWIVRNGINYVNKSMDIDVSTSFVQEKAPRTGLGIWKNGSMVILQVDGQENIDYGMDLWEFSDLFLRLGVDSAINFDGGGSSTSVYQNQVIDYPTCDDNSTKCECQVTSILCVKIV